jgi:hypothetical protein
MMLSLDLREFEMQDSCGRDEIIRELVWRCLVLEWDHCTAVAAEGGDFLQISVGAGQRHDGTVAVDSVAGGREVPTSTFGMFGDLAGSGGLAQGFLRAPRNDRQTEHQG